MASVISLLLTLFPFMVISFVYWDHPCLEPVIWGLDLVTWMFYSATCIGFAGGITALMRCICVTRVRLVRLVLISSVWVTSSVAFGVGLRVVTATSDACKSLTIEETDVIIKDAAKLLEDITHADNDIIHFRILWVTSLIALICYGTLSLLTLCYLGAQCAPANTAPKRSTVVSTPEPNQAQPVTSSHLLRKFFVKQY